MTTTTATRSPGASFDAQEIRIVRSIRRRLRRLLRRLETRIVTDRFDADLSRRIDLVHVVLEQLDAWGKDAEC